MKILIRNINDNDLSNVKELNELLLPENYPLEIWEDWFNKGKEFSFIAIDNLTVIGYILCDGKKIISLAIKSEYRHNGIGKQLILNCLSVIENNIGLYCRISNLIAINLYKNCGFNIYKKINGYYQSLDKEKLREDGYLMVRKYKKINEFKTEIDLIKDNQINLNKLRKELKLFKKI